MTGEFANSPIRRAGGAERARGERVASCGRARGGRRRDV